MIHLIFVLLVIAGFLSFGSFRLLKMKSMEKEARSRYTLKAVQGVFRRILRASGTKLEIEGLENIPEREAVLFVGNHRSFFDIVIGYTLVKNPTGFIAKVELSKVPMLRRWMEELGCRFLDRNNIKQNLKVILGAIKDIKEGKSVWIYPEGTRSEGEDETALLPFKDGSFKIAEKSGCKIIPVAMLGTRAILEAQFPRIRASRVKVRIGKPIVFQELSEEERQNIGAYVREQVISALREMEAEA